MFNMRIKLAVSEAYGKDYHFFYNWILRLDSNHEMNPKLTSKIDLEILNNLKKIENHPKLKYLKYTTACHQFHCQQKQTFQIDAITTPSDWLESDIHWLRATSFKHQFEIRPKTKNAWK